MKLFYRICLLVFLCSGFLLISKTSIAQIPQRSQQFLDSLRKNNIAVDILDLRLKARELVHEAKWDSAANYYQMALNNSREQEINGLIALNINALQLVYFFRGNYRKSQSLTEEIFTLSGIPYDVLSDAYQGSASHFSGKSMLDTAELLVIKAIEIDRNYKDLRSLPGSLNVLGHIKSKQGFNMDALNFHLEALSYLQMDFGLRKAVSLYDVSKAFYSIRNNAKAREYLMKCREICEENGFKNQLASVALLSAHIHRTDGKVVKAIEEYHYALDLARERKADFRVGECLLGLAQCKLRLSEPFEAFNFLKEIDINAEDNEDFANSFELALAEFYLLSQSSNSAAQIQKIQKIAAENKDIYLTKRTQYLSYMFYKSSNPSKALEHFEKHRVLTDSIFQMQQSQHMNQMEAQYDLVSKEKQIAILDANSAISELKISQQKKTVLLTSIGLVLFAILSFFLFRLMRKVKSQNAKLASADNEKATLLREIHHRVKNNLQVISSLLALQSSYIEDDSAISALKQGQDRVQSMALIHQDLYQKENLSGVNSQEYFSKLVSNLKESYALFDKEISLEFHVEPLLLDVDTMIPLGLVLNELISNSLKHAFRDRETGKITVSLELDESELILSVIDDGRGLESAEDLNGKSFGYELIRAFAQKLNATIENNFESGFETKLRIKKYKLAA